MSGYTFPIRRMSIVLLLCQVVVPSMTPVCAYREKHLRGIYTLNINCCDQVTIKDAAFLHLRRNFRIPFR